MLKSFFTRPRPSPPPKEPAALSVRHEGVDYPVDLKREARARRYTLRFNAARRTVVLTLPARGRISEARAFLARNSGWVAERLSRLPDHTPFTPGESIPLHGAPHRLVHVPERRGTVARIEGEGGPELHVFGDEAFFSRRVGDFLKKEARRALVDASLRHAASLGVKPSRISLKDTVSRWGSCSSKGVLSYSWRIVLAPPDVLDYLAAHEVAHLREMNHSPAFWALVKRICPQMEPARDWLKQNGSSLHHYG